MNFKENFSSAESGEHQNKMLEDPTGDVKVLQMTLTWSLKHHCFYICNWKTDYVATSPS